MMSRKRLIPGFLFLLLCAYPVSVSTACAGAAPPASDSLKVGDRAPDFELTDHRGETVGLSQFRGKKNVILAFYVLAFTSG